MSQGTSVKSTRDASVNVGDDTVTIAVQPGGEAVVEFEVGGKRMTVRARGVDFEPEDWRTAGLSEWPR